MVEEGRGREGEGRGGKVEGRKMCSSKKALE
jgi:hypothetical protein